MSRYRFSIVRIALLISHARRLELSENSFWEIEKGRGFVDPFPGLNMRKVDMDAYNRPKPTLERRQLQYYRVIGDMPDDPNLHACAHLYASDRKPFEMSNSLGSKSVTF